MEAIEVGKRIAAKRGRKSKPEHAKSFKFTKTNLGPLTYEGNGIYPDKRFDSGCNGLVIFVSPTLIKTFYVVANRKMWNSKKQRHEKNAVYKKLFLFNPDAENQTLKAARALVADKKKEILNGRESVQRSQKTFESLSLDFLKSGFSGYRLADKSEKHEYKEATINKYKKLINTYILLKPSKFSKSKIQKGKFNNIAGRLTGIVEYKDIVSSKPLKDYTLNEITEWHVEVVHHRLKDTPTVANDVIKVISIIYTWAKTNGRIKGPNPCSSIVKFPEKKIKAKLLDDHVEKIMNHCKSKAFDFAPFFCTVIILLLNSGKRNIELWGLRWRQPFSPKEELKCSGWLEENWEQTKYLYLRDTKNRKPERVFLDAECITVIKRLEANAKATK